MDFNRKEATSEHSDYMLKLRTVIMAVYLMKLDNKSIPNNFFELSKVKAKTNLKSNQIHLLS